MSHPSSRYLSLTPFFLRALILSVLVAGAGKMTIVYAQVEDQTVAIVNGRRITQREVDRAVAAQLLPLEEQIYALRKAALDNLVFRTILEDEAAKRGLTVEELRRRLTAGKVEIQASEVEKVYAENAQAFAAMSPDEAKERLRLDMESQARMQNYREALLRLKESSRIEFRLEEPRLPMMRDDGRAPSKGDRAALITITEFADFQCPYCRQSQISINQVLQQYKDRIRLVFKHLPLEEIHPQAFPAAQAALCAGEQGSFWQYHDALFASESLSPEVFKRLASGLGLNVPALEACTRSEASRAAVLKDLSEAKQLGINSTPTFIINGRVFRGAPSFEGLKAAIERELKAVEAISHTQ
jgi:predicted DsbA family dithiol-disulfide isomerase